MAQASSETYHKDIDEYGKNGRQENQQSGTTDTAAPIMTDGRRLTVMTMEFLRPAKSLICKTAEWSAS